MAIIEPITVTEQRDFPAMTVEELQTERAFWEAHLHDPGRPLAQRYIEMIDNEMHRRDPVGDL